MKTTKTYLADPKMTAPVVYLTAEGEPSSEAVHALPLVKVVFSWEMPTLTEGRYILGGLKTTYALIDTGADYSMLSKRFAAGAGPALQVFDHTALGTQERISNYDITLMFPPADNMIRAGVVLSEAIPERSVFQMVLGRHFLKTTRFLYDGPSAIQELHFLDADEMKARGVE